jgi:hypothetical protein
MEAVTIPTTADRRLVEYFVIISTIEKSSTDNSSGDIQKSASNGDISFSDWRTETSGTISSSVNSDKNYDAASYDKNGNHNLHELFSAVSFQPTITARYPLHDHSDNPLHDNVIFFCHPSGNIHLRTEPYMPKVSVHLDC